LASRQRSATGIFSRVERRKLFSCGGNKTDFFASDQIKNGFSPGVCSQVERRRLSVVKEAPKDKSVQEQSDVPKHIAYGLFFGEMMVLQKKAQEREQQGIEARTKGSTRPKR
jgi:hypothetical protein